MSNPYSWYARYPRDYGEKTAHLSLAEHGAYTLLLDHYMTSGGAIAIAMPIAMHLLPVCYRICRAQSDEERAAVESVVRQYFTVENGKEEKPKRNKGFRCKERRSQALGKFRDDANCYANCYSNCYA